MASVPTTADLKLSCRPSKEGKKLVFEYSLHNLSDADVYVMHAILSVDPSTKEAFADDKAACVILGTNGDALIGKFVAPLPTNLRPAIQMVPMALRLAAGNILARRLEVTEPLAEMSPYLPDLKLRQYEVIDIDAVVFAVSYWVSGAAGIAVAPSPHAPDLFSVIAAKAGVGSALVSQRFQTRGLQVFRRTDQFPRSVAGS
jgi:hypothetical protein